MEHGAWSKEHGRKTEKGDGRTEKSERVSVRRGDEKENEKGRMGDGENRRRRE
jgi:hypothetical protein